MVSYDYINLFTPNLSRCGPISQAIPSDATVAYNYPIGRASSNSEWWKKSWWRFHGVRFSKNAEPFTLSWPDSH